jgi:3-dehydroquinate synthetase
MLQARYPQVPETVLAAIRELETLPQREAWISFEEHVSELLSAGVIEDVDIHDVLQNTGEWGDN